jgi:hypothetical protein
MNGLIGAPGLAESIFTAIDWSAFDGGSSARRLVRQSVSASTAKEIERMAQNPVTELRNCAKSDMAPGHDTEALPQPLIVF